MKKYFVIILFAATLTFAQTEQQGIELPDFVITGRQNIDLPIAVKRKPDIISTISKDFLTPQILPEELPLLFSSEPIPIQPDIKKLNDYYQRTFKLQAGRYSLPVGLLNVNQSLDNYLLNASMWGSNNQEYIPNSGYNNFGASLSNEFFFSTKSDFLPGAKFKLAAEYSRGSYHLYASKDPAYLRETNSGLALISLRSSYNRWINFGLDLNGNIFALSESGLKESNIEAAGLLEIKMNSLIVGAKGSFIKQFLSNNLSGNNGGDYFSTQSYFTMNPTSIIKFTIGVDYSSTSANTFFSPYGSFDIKLDKGFTFSAGYNPHTQFINTTDLLKKNLYYNPGIIDNVFSKYKIELNGKLKYEYEKIFSISLSGGYSKVKDYYYFEDVTENGKFDLIVLPEAKIISASLDFIFNPDYFGYFFGNIKYKDVKDDFDNIIPYEPKIFSTLTYGYDFKFGLGFSAKYQLAFNIYSNLVNANKLNDYHNISVSFYYELFKGLKLTADFQNILNRANFVWKQYQEKPFDLLLGIEYRW